MSAITYHLINKNFYIFLLLHFWARKCPISQKYKNSILRISQCLSSSMISSKPAEQIQRELQRLILGTKMVRSDNLTKQSLLQKTKRVTFNHLLMPVIS